MCVVFEPQKCGQCACHSANFQHDVRTGSYEITCGRCGRHERHELLLDDEGFYCGFRHEVGQGFGVLFFRYTSGHEFYSCCLNTSTQLVEADAWLRQRLASGAVDADNASLSRWNSETQQIESMFGERVDLLAGKIVRVSGVPGDEEHGNQRRSQAPKGQCDD